MQIMVYPATKNSLVIRHPISGPLVIGGSLWEEDAFTMRMLTEFAITTNKASGFNEPSALVDITKSPPHATYPIVEPDKPPEEKVTTRTASAKS